MFARECSLCGGKLRNNICTECGLDNSKNDSMYRGMINKSDCDGAPLTHVHEDPAEKPKRVKVKKQKAESSYNYTDGQKSKDKKKSVKIIPIIIAVCALIGPLADLIVNLTDEFSYGVSEMDIHEVMPPSAKDASDDGMYANAPYNLVETGVFWAADLTSGDYVVGVHIPEGTYRVYANVGDCYLSVEDWDNGIYFWEQMAPEDMGMENSYYEIYDLRLYQGAVVKIDGYYPLWFESENANQEDISLENPLTEEVSMVNGQTLTAGVDFPAGTYNVVTTASGGYLEFEVPVPEGQEFSEYYMNTIWLYGENGTGIQYNNLVIPEGVQVHLEGFPEEQTLVLSPSMAIATLDYEGYQKGEY